MKTRTTETNNRLSFNHVDSELPPFRKELIVATVKDSSLVFDTFTIDNNNFEIECYDWHSGDIGHMNWRYWIFAPKSIEDMSDHEKMQLFCSFQSGFEAKIKEVRFDAKMLKTKELF